MHTFFVCIRWCTIWDFFCFFKNCLFVGSNLNLEKYFLVIFHKLLQNIWCRDLFITNITVQKAIEQITRFGESGCLHSSTGFFSHLLYVYIYSSTLKYWAWLQSADRNQYLPHHQFYYLIFITKVMVQQLCVYMLILFPQQCANNAPSVWIITLHMVHLLIHRTKQYLLHKLSIFCYKLPIKKPIV